MLFYCYHRVELLYHRRRQLYHRHGPGYHHLKRDYHRHGVRGTLGNTFCDLKKLSRKLDFPVCVTALPYQSFLYSI